MYTYYVIGKKHHVMIKNALNNVQRPRRVIIFGVSYVLL